MKCKLSEKCEFGNLCKDATRHDSLTVLGCSSFKTKKPMTNEEWFCGLSTEEKAEFISEVRHGMSERVMEIEKIFNDEDLDYEEAVEKWLKGEHKA